MLSSGIHAHTHTPPAHTPPEAVKPSQGASVKDRVSSLVQLARSTFGGSGGGEGSGGGAGGEGGGVGGWDVGVGRGGGGLVLACPEEVALGVGGLARSIEEG